MISFSPHTPMKSLLLNLAALVQLVWVFPTSAMAQSTVTLTNFTYTAEKPVVGKIVPVTKGAVTTKVKLVGASTKLFELGKDNTLTVKKAAADPKAKWLDVHLETNGQPVTFRVVKDEFIKNRVVAHRGAWKNTGATENSIAALQHAIRLGCAGSEFDVHLSYDSVPVVNHDHSLQGYNIENTPLAQLKQLKLSNGENLPTLEAYLKAGMQQNKTMLVLEIKPSAVSKERGQQLAQKVVEMVRQHKAQGWIDYISFDYDILKKIKELDPYADVSYLNGDKTPAELAKDGMNGFDYHQNVLKQNPQWIEEAHSLNLTVNCWTVNSSAMMDWLLERKAHFITTNEPEMLLEKVKKLPNQ